MYMSEYFVILKMKKNMKGLILFGGDIVVFFVVVFIGDYIEYVFCCINIIMFLLYMYVLLLCEVMK